MIKEVQKNDPVKVTSPNPIGRKNIEAVLSLSREVALKELSKEFKAKLSNSKTEVLGIGGVHYYSGDVSLTASTIISIDPAIGFLEIHAKDVTIGSSSEINGNALACHIPYQVIAISNHFRFRMIFR